jgi:hypothetical protein
MFVIVQFVNTPNAQPEKLAILESLLLTQPDSQLDLHNTNARLSELLGYSKVGGLVLPQFEVEMPFVDRHNPFHQLVPIVKHQANIRPEMNPRVTAPVRIHSPFQPNSRKFSLVGATLIAHQWNVPEAGINKDEMYAHFEVVPLPDAPTIVTITAQREDWVRHGRSLLKFTAR